MYHERILPFLYQGYFEKKTTESLKMKDIFCPLQIDYQVTDEEIQSFYAQTNVQGFKPKVVDVAPLGIKVFDMKDRVSWFLRTYRGDDLFDCAVSYVDYSQIAANIEFLDGEASLKYNNSYDIAPNVITDSLINNAANGTVFNVDMNRLINGEILIPVSKEVSIYSGEYFNSIGESMGLLGEASLRANSAGKSIKNITSKVSGTVDANYSWLEAYLSAPTQQKQEKIPLLLGPTGVFKSATVKSLCKQLDLKLVDLRIAFASRMDFTGLYDKSVIDDKWFKSNCQMEEFVVCSDGFYEYCVSAIESINKILSDGYVEVTKGSDGANKVVEKEPLTQKQIDKMNAMLEKYKPYTKVPVLFFDEITRCKDEGVKGVLVTLLNKKKLENLTFNRCKFICASNSGLGDEILNAVYEVDEDNDVGYADRFKPMEITPTSVKDRWYTWATSDRTVGVYDDKGYKILDDKGNQKEEATTRKNIHPMILKYLEKNSSELYNLGYVKGAYNSGSRGDAVLTPFPNYRTWEFVSNYLYKKDSDPEKTIYKVVVDGLIGNSKNSYNDASKKTTKISDGSSDRFCKFLDSNGYKVVIDFNADNGEDELTSFTKETLDSGIASMLVGPSSLGKTARINEYAKSIGAELIEINLSTYDRADLMGVPIPITLNSYISGNSPDKDMTSINKALMEIAKNIKDKSLKDSSNNFLPEKLTVRAPDSDVYLKFKSCVERHVPCVLFFDECNRVINPAVMSAMFECVSDNRIFGIDFDPNVVKIVAACNYGEGYTVSDLDTALSARFAINRKLRFEPSDAKSYIKFLEGQDNPAINSNKIIVGFLNDIVKNDNGSYDKLVAMFNSVETKKIEKGTPTTRAFQQLSRDITSFATSPDYCGSLIFNNNMKSAKMSQKSILQSTSDYKGLYGLYSSWIPELLEHSSSWCGKGSSVTYEVMGEKYSPSDFLEQLEDYNRTFLNNPVVGSGMYDEFYKDDISSPTNKGSLKGMDFFEKDIKLLGACIDNISDVDDYVSMHRLSHFTSSVGKEVADKLTPYFNENFGGPESIILTIQMVLNDAKLVKKYVAQEFSGVSQIGVDERVAKMFELLNEFKTVSNCGGTTEHYLNYFGSVADVLGGDISVYGLGGSGNISSQSSESWKRLFLQMDSSFDPFMVNAEKGGDNFILAILNNSVATKYNLQDIEAMRQKIKSGPSASKQKIKRAKIL